MAKSKHARKHNTPQHRAQRPNVSEAEVQDARKTLSTPMGFEPLVLDVGDGIEWQFVPDLMPAQSIAIRKASNALADSFALEFDGDDSEHPINVAFAHLVNKIKDCMIPGSNPESFPQPLYGVQTISWFAGNIMVGRDTKLPT